MVLRIAPAANKLRACQSDRVITPYKAEEWHNLLSLYNLTNKHPNLIKQLISGFHVCAPIISHSFTPLNSPSINIHRDAFNTIVDKEFQKGHYIGSCSPDALESFIGAFQSSPLSIIPKSSKPGQFCIIQNLSYPHDSATSVNSQVDSNLFPCTWGTFYMAYTLIHSLPSGSQGATQDVAVAYYTIPLHHSQWPAFIV